MANLHVMTTSNPKSDYPFSWTIENFQWASKQLLGPPFSPIPGFPESFRFECEYKVKFCPSNLKYDQFFHVRLVYLNPKKLQLYVFADITLSNMQMILFRKSCKRTKIQPTTTSLIIYTPDELMEIVFKEGVQASKLKLEGTLTFSGYELSTSVSVEPLSIQQPSGNFACTELVKDFKAIYESGHCSDVIFKIGDEELRAHKGILAARSPAFAKMIDDHLLMFTKTVTIEDIDIDTFNHFLLFMYTGAVEDFKCKSMISLYPVSKKYEVPSLQKFCVLSLSSVLTVDDACDVILLADMYKDKELMEIVKIFVQKNFLDIAVTTKWAELVANQPELVKKVVDFIKPVYNN